MNNEPTVLFPVILQIVGKERFICVADSSTVLFDKPF